jgi:hypothetical protein
MPMISRKPAKNEAAAPRSEPARRAKRPYEKPRLVDYGPVSKLTMSGGTTIADSGNNMMQPCL